MNCAYCNAPNGAASGLCTNPRCLGGPLALAFSECAALRSERAAALSELARMRPVVEAAVAWDVRDSLLTGIDLKSALKRYREAQP